MNSPYEISVILATYNRCEIFPAAIESALNQTTDVKYEVLIVDNNSTDQTRVIGESIAARVPYVRYLFEPLQGVSYARNTGIRAARAPIIAFFDDDVRVTPDWIANIRQAFQEHPEVDCIGGRVLPLWESEPPSWLTERHWMPLALQDYGDEAFEVTPEQRRGLIGANLCCRRKVFVNAGLFAPDLQRVLDAIGSMEDHEFLLRLWASSCRIKYLPALTAYALVTQERMTKRYHRKWHRGHGSFYAMLRTPQMEDSRRGHLFDVPAHLYRQCVTDMMRLIRDVLLNNRDGVFTHETGLWFFCGFFRRRFSDFIKLRRAGLDRQASAALGLRARPGWMKSAGKRGWRQSRVNEKLRR